jgi:hypothetical protein
VTAYALTTQQNIVRQLLAADSSSAFECTPVPIASPQAGALTQAVWHLDGVNGLDSNSGLPGSPVRTVMGGIVPKWGSNVVTLPQSTTIFVDVSQAPGIEDIFLDVTLTAPGSTFAIVGTYTQLFAPTTLGAVVARNRATNQKLTVNPGVPLAVGLMVRNTQAGKLSRAYIEAAPGGPGITTMKQPLALASATVQPIFSSAAEVNTWAGADTCIFEAPTGLNVRSITVHGAGDFGAGFTSQMQCWIQAIEFLPPANGPFSFVNLTFDGSVGGIVLDCLCNPNAGTFMVSRCTSQAPFAIHQNCLYGFGANFATSHTVFGGGSTVSGGSYSFSGGGNVVDNDCQLIGAYISQGMCGLSYGTANANGTGAGAGSGFGLSVGGFRAFNSIELSNGPSSGTTALWGSGSFNATNGTKVVKQIGISATWVNTLLFTGTGGTLAIDSNVQNSFVINFATGAWTVTALTPANLDASTMGIINPISGSGFVLST